MITESYKDGEVTYQQSEQMVKLAEKWLLEYFNEAGPKRPGDLEDDFAGTPEIEEIFNSGLLGRWRNTPFFPSLARLIDKGLIEYTKDSRGDFWYAIPGKLPKTAL